ncbi:MAG: DUF262 domain-containing protein, partial [Chloroflexi bacterium]|nr:DUF262 domain-containing protein [Chloroflexota bacterium]
DPLARYKLSPTPSDRVVFHDIMENDYASIRTKYSKYYWGNRVPKNTSLLALRAYELFRENISDFALFGSVNDISHNVENIADETDTEEAVEARFEALLAALLSRMKLVVIILGEDDDAQVVFETLNSKGEPLLAMDLVRNNIFHRAERQSLEIDELYQELWDPFDQPWWRESAPFSRPRRPRLDHFLAYTLAAETGENISMRELYAEYRAFAVPRGQRRFHSVEDELRVLQHYAPLYKVLEGEIDGDQTLAWLGTKFVSWQLTTAYPVAMRLMREDVSSDERQQIARLIYSYIVRRTLCGLTSKNLNRVFQSLTHAFVQATPSVANLRAFFVARVGDSTRFPDDREFTQGILAQPAYQLAHGTRMADVLWELELASRSSLAEQMTKPTGMWVEHVLPRSWNEDWPFDDGVFTERWSGEVKAQDRNRVIHTLGNLTLLSSKLNISSGNRKFVEKAEKFEKHTGLFLNKWFTGKSRWAEVEIQERSQYLASLAVEVWPDL